MVFYIIERTVYCFFFQPDLSFLLTCQGTWSHPYFLQSAPCPLSYHAVPMSGHFSLSISSKFDLLLLTLKLILVLMSTQIFTFIFLTLEFC